MVNKIVLSPVLFFILFWSVIISVGGIDRFEFYPFSDTFYLYMLAVFCVFSISAYLGGVSSNSFYANKTVETLKFTFKHKNHLQIYLFFMSLGIAVMCWQHYKVVGIFFWTPAEINHFRYLVTEGGVSVSGGVLSFFNFFFYTMIPLLATVNKRDRSKYKKIFILLLLVYIYLSSARASMFVIALIGFFYYTILNKQAGLGKLVLLFLLLIFAFVLLGTLTGKGHFDSIWRYAFGPIHALDRIIVNGAPAGSPDLYLFRPLHSLFFKLDLLSPSSSRLLPYVSTPYTINVYTVFGPYIMDFGIYGSLVCVSFWAFVSGFIIKLGKKLVSPFTSLLAALCLTLIILGVFYDYYLSSAFPWIIVILGSVLFPKRYDAAMLNRI